MMNTLLTRYSGFFFEKVLIVKQTNQQIGSGGIFVLQGLSFLDLRYNLLLFYLQDLTHLIGVKTEGGKIKDSEALSRVVTIRTVRTPTRRTVVSDPAWFLLFI